MTRVPTVSSDAGASPLLMKTLVSARLRASLSRPSCPARLATSDENPLREARAASRSDSIRATAIYVFISVPAKVIFALLVAQLLNQKIPFLRALRTIYYMPTVVAGVAAALLWVTLLQQDGSTSLLNSAGTSAPDTGPMPGAGQACPAPLLTDSTSSPTVCGYRVVVRVTLPPSAPPGSYSLTLRATSVFNPAVSDDVTFSAASTRPVSASRTT